MGAAMHKLLVLVVLLSACNSNKAPLPFDAAAVFGAPSPAPTTPSKVVQAPAAPAPAASADSRVRADGFSIHPDRWTTESPKKGNLIELSRTTTSNSTQRFTVARLADELPANVFEEAGCATWKATIKQKSRIQRAEHRIVSGAFGKGCEVATMRGDHIVILTAIPSNSGLPYSALCSGAVAEMKEVLSACDAPISSWRVEAPPRVTPPADGRARGRGFSLALPSGWDLRPDLLEPGTELSAIYAKTEDTVRSLTVLRTASKFANKTNEECSALGKRLKAVAARNIPTYDDRACEVIVEEGADLVALSTFQADKEGNLLTIRCGGLRSDAKAAMAACHEIAKTIRLE
jgi:hypothetical protein